MTGLWKKLFESPVRVFVVVVFYVFFSFSFSSFTPCQNIMFNEQNSAIEPISGFKIAIFWCILNKCTKAFERNQDPS